jgi:hypothetical protein
MDKQTPTQKQIKSIDEIGSKVLEIRFNNQTQQKFIYSRDNPMENIQLIFNGVDLIRTGRKEVLDEVKKIILLYEDSEHPINEILDAILVNIGIIKLKELEHK